MNGKKYFDMYEQISNEYNRAFTRTNWKMGNGGAYEAHYRLLELLKKMAANSGFNTNPPDAMYDSARGLFEEVSLGLQGDDKKKDFKNERELLKRARWAVFENLDYLGARDLLKKIRIKND